MTLKKYHGRLCFFHFLNFCAEVSRFMFDLLQKKKLKDVCWTRRRRKIFQKFFVQSVKVFMRRSYSRRMKRKIQTTEMKQV